MNLYLHIPFCPRICPYCAFPVVRVDKALAAAFAPRLLAEWESRRRGRSFSTVYFGGGTPTALSERDLERILPPVLAAAAPGAEVTMECNPSTLSDAKARRLRALGVNRLSIGAQAFDPAVLRVLGRAHAPAGIRACVESARRAEFAQINLDLIFGVPGQTEAAWETTLRAALELEPEHLSCYGLTYEGDTEFFRRFQRGEMKPAPEVERRMFALAEDLLGDAGFVHYEISNYARPGAECRHNLDGWSGRDYLGIGPGAVSTERLTPFEAPGSERARAAAADPGGRNSAGEPFRRGAEGRPPRELREIVARRLRNGPISAEGAWEIAEREELARATLASERIALGLRTRRGVEEEAFARDFGFSLRTRWATEIARLVEEGFAQPAPPLRLTRKGWLVADEIAQMFL